MSIAHPYDRNVSALYFDEYPDPAVGLGYIILLPRAVRIQIVSADFILTTDANVADRYVYIAPSLVPDHRLHFFAERQQPASTAYHYSAYMGAPGENGIAPLSNRVRMSLGVDIIIDNVDSIIINAEGLQAGDQFSTLRIYYNYWFTGVAPT